MMLCVGGKMTQQERRVYLIGELLKENKEIEGFPIPANTVIPSNIEEQRQLLRALFNVRPPFPIHSEFIKIQDEYLKEEIQKKGIVDYNLSRRITKKYTPLIIKYLFMKMTIQIKREIDFLKHLTYLLIILYNA